MRAIFLSNIQVSDENTICVDGDQGRHLSKVVRLSVGEEILVLNGGGEKIFARAREIGKNSVVIDILNTEKVERSHHIDLAIGVTKKDAVEEIVKSATELGVRKIIPLFSQFSQSEFARSSRLDRIIESALIQSNNSFLPIIEDEQRLSDFFGKEHDYKKMFSFAPMTNTESLENFSLRPSDPILVVIGPEGGFSLQEHQYLRGQGCFEISFPCPILRAKTSVPCAFGHIFSYFN